MYVTLLACWQFQGGTFTLIGVAVIYDAKGASAKYEKVLAMNCRRSIVWETLKSNISAQRDLILYQSKELGALVPGVSRSQRFYKKTLLVPILAAYTTGM